MYTKDIWWFIIPNFIMNKIILNIFGIIEKLKLDVIANIFWIS